MASLVKPESDKCVHAHAQVVVHEQLLESTCTLAVVMVIYDIYVICIICVLCYNLHPQKKMCRIFSLFKSLASPKMNVLLVIKYSHADILSHSVTQKKRLGQQVTYMFDK